ncbi:SigE family RNA polymerase sigma factor [Actinoplanes sp. Pm04-4]|uniref:SigE family RNA polymerase sigma factor n=1 Tax=Paractinoplanes pyxinae TaxID=2997416 RepID=A0ABT4B788_9ACTN|nr:SigE family RNA polymerase sigma factor [Actinoplanes pyxinae]MCY1142373.1 SigE family RNA polymerase sigma factor [Actinoplanes pyxinae]
MSTHSPADDGFRAFVEQQWGPLVRVAYLLTGDRGHAEDLVQAALEKTHRKWGRVSRMEAPVAYVRKAMVNTAISWRRRRRVSEVPLLATDSPPGSSGADAYGSIEQRQQVTAALRTLPPRMRAVLVLRYFADLGESEVAELLGCSVGTVKSQASRGLDRLRAHLNPVPERTRA